VVGIANNVYNNERYGNDEIGLWLAPRPRNKTANKSGISAPKPFSTRSCDPCFRHNISPEALLRPGAIVLGCMRISNDLGCCHGQVASAPKVSSAKYCYVAAETNRGVASAASNAATKKGAPLSFAPADCHRDVKSLARSVNSATIRPFGEPHGLLTPSVCDLRPDTFHFSGSILFRTNNPFTPCRRGANQVSAQFPSSPGNANCQHVG
jgi:hypothetical protein